MKRVSGKVFWSVLVQGVRQALGWFFGLFGYKRNGRAATIIWHIFSVSAAIVMAIIAAVLVYALGDTIYEKYQRSYGNHDIDDCYMNTFISRDIYYHDHGNGNGVVFNIHDGTQYLKHVAWIGKPLGEDSLVVFSDGKRRGFFNGFTGAVVVPAKYEHAWVFSDGLAAVEEDNYIKFIDSTGKVVLDNKIAYMHGTEGYVFHGGYCVVNSKDGRKYGLMDKTGKIILPQEYLSIRPSGEGDYWTVEKDKEMTVLGKDLKPILPFMECSMFVGKGTIDVTMPDHTMRKYDLQGHLLDGFFISSTSIMEYDTDEVRYKKVEVVDNADEDEDSDEGETKSETTLEPYHPIATARLRSYIAGDGYMGLITPEGKVVTMPLYENIEAIGYDTYLATVTNGDAVIINGKGEYVNK